MANDDARSRPGETAGPHPPRYRWLVRIAALYVLVIAAVAGVRWWWGNVSGSRFETAIAAAHARGEKILVVDYAPGDPIPDEQNAAFYFGRALKAIKFSKTEEWAIGNAGSLPLREDIFDTLGEALRSHQQVLADLRAARAAPKADWGIKVASPMWSVLLPHLNHTRRLANILKAAALHAAHRGDHAAAVEHVLDIEPLMRSLDDQPFLITHLVRIGVEAVAADAAAEIARDLEIAGGSGGNAPVPATGVSSPASREQVRALIALLLDDGPRRSSFMASLEGERAAQVDVGVSVATRTYLVRPAIQMDTVTLANEGDQLLAAAAAPDWTIGQKLMPPVPVVNGPRTTAHVVSQMIRPALGRAVSTSYRGAAQSRLAATALAIRMYQRDHGGQRPPTLAALVPDYLPAVPLDPMATNGATIGYIPDPVAPYVYSVGDNGTDDSAASPPWRPDKTTVSPYKATDLFVSLTRANLPPPEIEDPPSFMEDPAEMAPAATPPSTQPQ
jgi:hypothetical protein